MELVYYPNPILNTKCKSIPIMTEALHNTAKEMIDLMYKSNGVGLAAPQIGLDIQMFVMISNPEKGGEPIIVINPTITHYDGEPIKTTEGCLSIPGIEANLSCRHEIIEVEMYNVDGVYAEGVRKYTFMDKEAIIFQHEYDHLQGITLFERMEPMQRMLKEKKYKKLQKRAKQGR